MFITFEGPEGSGKTSQIVLLAEFLREQGYEVVQTREPGGTSIGDQIRDVLHDVNNGEITAVTELLLYSASRAQLVRELVQPALVAGKIILCDRYADSTIAYQGYGRELDLRELNMLTQFATGGLKPHLTLLLDIDVERGLARRQVGGDEMNRLDLEAVSFHQKVRDGYHTLVEAEPERWVTVDADRPVDAIQKELREIVAEKVAEWQGGKVAE
ncbi:MAG: dTMP kinase [Aquificales bacterium]|nr:dTMP kinase [Aquificales bacterium]